MVVIIMHHIIMHHKQYTNLHLWQMLIGNLVFVNQKVPFFTPSLDDR